MRSPTPATARWSPTAEIQIETGNGFDTTGNSAYINLAYVTWAGLTAGKAPSFFSFTGGGAGWANFFSPDEQGFNQPDLLAYTATFGGGASATHRRSSPTETMGGSGGGTQTYDLGGDDDLRRRALARRRRQLEDQPGLGLGAGRRRRARCARDRLRRHDDDEDRLGASTRA